MAGAQMLAAVPVVGKINNADSTCTVIGVEIGQEVSLAGRPVGGVEGQEQFTLAGEIEQHCGVMEKIAMTAEGPVCRHVFEGTRHLAAADLLLEIVYFAKPAPEPEFGRAPGRLVKIDHRNLVSQRRIEGFLSCRVWSPQLLISKKGAWRDSAGIIEVVINDDLDSREPDIGSQVKDLGPRQGVETACGEVQLRIWMLTEENETFFGKLF